MGKRKNQADHHKTIVPDPLPNSSQMEAVSAQKSSHQVESSTLTPIPSLLQQLHDSVKLSPAPQVNLNNSILQRNPRYCNRKYSRRNSTSHADALTSHVNDDEKMILKFSNKCISNDATMKAEVEGDEKEEEEEACNKQGRISLSVAKSVSMDMRKMVCGICGRVLRKKPMNVRRSLSFSEPSVVAVLVCGHLYHGDCLEQRTCSAEKTDPSCPSCINFVSQDDFSVDFE